MACAIAAAAVKGSTPWIQLVVDDEFWLLARLREHFDAQYADSPFVRVVDGSPKLKNVVASNMAEVAVAVSDDTVVVMSAIDNLVKGAAGGAMQWMNRLWGLPETTGLATAAPGWT